MTEPLLPYAEEAEGAVVASILIDNGVLPEVMALVSAEDFHDPRYRLMFQAQMRLGVGIDHLTLVEELRYERGLSRFGG
jgi:replicative DNA helicase